MVEMTVLLNEERFVDVRRRNSRVHCTERTVQLLRGNCGTQIWGSKTLWKTYFSILEMKAIRLGNGC